MIHKKQRHRCEGAQYEQTRYYLSVVQVLTDLNLSITISDISLTAAGLWMYFMLWIKRDAKFSDQDTIEYIQKSLGYKTKREKSSADLLRSSTGLIFLVYRFAASKDADAPPLPAFPAWRSQYWERQHL